MSLLSEVSIRLSVGKKLVHMLTMPVSFICLSKLWVLASYVLKCHPYIIKIKLILHVYKSSCISYNNPGLCERSPCVQHVSFESLQNKNCLSYVNEMRHTRQGWTINAARMTYSLQFLPYFANDSQDILLTIFFINFKIFDVRFYSAFDTKR